MHFFDFWIYSFTLESIFLHGSTISKSSVIGKSHHLSIWKEKQNKTKLFHEFFPPNSRSNHQISFFLHQGDCFQSVLVKLSTLVGMHIISLSPAVVIERLQAEPWAQTVEPENLDAISSPSVMTERFFPSPWVNVPMLCLLHFSHVKNGDGIS